MTLRLRLGALCFASILSANAQANDFSQFFSSFDTLSADFHQTLLDAQDRQLEVSQGRLLFARPSYLRWETTRPSQQVLLLNEQQLYLIDYELEQVSQRSLDNKDNTPIYWLSHAPDALENLPQYSHSREGIDWYQANEHLYFGFKNTQLSAIRHTNSLAQSIVIELDNVVVNPEVSTSVFSPKVPIGFDLIKLF